MQIPFDDDAAKRLCNVYDAGSKRQKNRTDDFSETFLVGIAATLVGSAVGVGLTSIVHRLLVDQLDLNISHFTPFSIHGLLITVLFCCFVLLAAVVNAFRLSKTDFSIDSCGSDTNKNQAA